MGVDEFPVLMGMDVTLDIAWVVVVVMIVVPVLVLVLQGQVVVLM